MKDLILIINKVLNNEKLRNELENLESGEQIYDFFIKNGYENDYDEFYCDMKEFFDLFETFEVDLNSISGGLGTNSGKMAATHSFQFYL